MNPLPADDMTPSDRLDEVARLLALAILRRKARLEKDADSGKNALAFHGDLRPHVTPEGGGS